MIDKESELNLGIEPSSHDDNNRDNLSLQRNRAKLHISEVMTSKNTIADLDFHVKKILEENGLSGDIIEKLGKLSKKDLDSILMKLFAEKSKKVDKDAILKQFNSNNICHGINVDIRKLHEIEYKMNLQLPDKYELLNLSHLNPFGLNAFLTKNNQKKMLTTSKNYDLTSDGGTALALEGVKRRTELKKNKEKKDDLVCLATHFHCMRTQIFGKRKPPHFKVFCTAICGKDSGNEDFDVNAVVETVDYYLKVISSFQKEKIISMGKIIINISDMGILDKLSAHTLHKDEKEVTEDLSSFRLDQVTSNDDLFRYLDIPESSTYQNISEIDASFIDRFGLKSNVAYLAKIFHNLKQMEKKYEDLGVEIHINLGRTKGLGCYNRLAIEMLSPAKSGKILDIMDGGIANWNATLMGDNKERIFVSGLGTDRLVEYYNPE